MNKGVSRILKLLTMSCIFYSCAAGIDETSETGISFGAIADRINSNAGKLKSLNAEGEISIDTPTLSNNGSLTVSINRPDSIYTKIEGPFGIDIADVLISREEFTYYNATDNKVITGPASQRNLGILLKMKVTFDDLVNALSGNFMITNYDSSDYKVMTMGDKYLLEQKTDNSTYRYYINSDYYYIERIQELDKLGKLNLEIKYEQFYTNSGVYFPKKVIITRPKEKQYIWVTYTSEQINPGKLKYRMKIPGSAKRVRW